MRCDYTDFFIDWSPAPETKRKDGKSIRYRLFLYGFLRNPRISFDPTYYTYLIHSINFPSIYLQFNLHVWIFPMVIKKNFAWTLLRLSIV